MGFHDEPEGTEDAAKAALLVQNRTLLKSIEHGTAVKLYSANKDDNF
jgi:hypothetical protein